MERENDRLRAAAMGFDPEGGTVRRLGEPFWTASFWGHGPGRQTVPTVRRKTAYSGRSWSRRIDYGDDGLAQDLWRQVVDEQHDLNRTLDLVEAVVRNDDLKCRKLLLELLNSPDIELDTVPLGPRGEDLRRIVRGFRPADGRVRPFRVKAHEIDWTAFGRVVIGWLITRQVDFAMPIVTVSATNRFSVEWQASSLLEVIYLELLEHVRERPGFGVALCERCGGRILRSRREGGTGNRWHRGCQAGRTEQWRRAHPDWRSRRASR